MSVTDPAPPEDAAQRSPHRMQVAQDVDLERLGERTVELLRVERFEPRAEVVQPDALHEGVEPAEAGDDALHGRFVRRSHDCITADDGVGREHLTRATAHFAASRSSTTT